MASDECEVIVATGEVDPRPAATEVIAFASAVQGGSIFCRGPSPTPNKGKKNKAKPAKKARKAKKKKKKNALPASGSGVGVGGDRAAAKAEVAEAERYMHSIHGKIAQVTALGDAKAEASADCNLLQLLYDKPDSMVVFGEQDEEGSSYAGFIHALVVLECPKEFVWEMLNLPERQHEFLPHLSSSKLIREIKQEDGTKLASLVEFSVSILLFFQIVYRTQHWFYPERSRLEWHLDPDFANGITKQTGHWQLFKWTEERTLIEYATQVDTGKHVPKSVQAFFAKKEIPRELQAFKHHMESAYQQYLLSQASAAAAT